MVKGVTPSPLLKIVYGFGNSRNWESARKCGNSGWLWGFARSSKFQLSLLWIEHVNVLLLWCSMPNAEHDFWEILAQQDIISAVLTDTQSTPHNHNLTIATSFDMLLCSVGSSSAGSLSAGATAGIVIAVLAAAVLAVVAVWFFKFRGAGR